jgi:hypothetical protein
MTGKLELGASMASAKEFRERAAECRRMAEGASNGMMQCVWARLAERWLTCAALVESKLPESNQAQTSH